jgi:indolepyruvate ferredoxin oxidoreductase, beta subunit
MSDPVSTVRPVPASPDSQTLMADAAQDSFNVLIVGVGGQGVIMVSKVLALLAQTQGFEVKQSEVHGMAKRGGSVFSHVRFGRRVWSPTIPKGEVDILVALEWAEGLRWLPFLKPGAGIFICDTKRIVPPFACLNRHPGAPLRYSKETPAEVIAHVAEGYAIDATHMAEKLGNERVANVILLGALSTALEFSAADWERTVAEFVPKKTVAVNLEAFRRGRDWIEEARNTTLPVEAPGLRTPAPADAAYRVRLEINPAWCKSCDICVKLCPEHCLRLNADRIVELAEPDKCTGCRLCEWLCPDFAIRVHLDTAAATAQEARAQ